MTNSSATPAQIIADNYRRIVDRVAAASSRAGRSPSDVLIVGVTKYVGAQLARHLVDAGCHQLGESRPQELAKKASDPLLTGDVDWHMVGHLQRNKVEITLRCDPLIHSVDSERLLRAVDRAAEKQQRMARVLLEVNCSGDAEKHGAAPGDLPTLLDVAGELPHVGVLGLMTMAARDGGHDVARRNFATLRALLEQSRASRPELPLSELSMGMSGDFEQAIAEGATLVRVGSALWEGIDTNPKR